MNADPGLMVSGLAFFVVRMVHSIGRVVDGCEVLLKLICFYQRSVEFAAFRFYSAVNCNDAFHLHYQCILQQNFLSGSNDFTKLHSLTFW